MSKLAHSDEKTIDELERKRAIENGDEDLLQWAEPREPSRRTLQRWMEEAASFPRT